MKTIFYSLSFFFFLSFFEQKILFEQKLKQLNILTRNTMHAATPRLGIQRTIFSEHEVLESWRLLSVLPFRYIFFKL